MQINKTPYYFDIYSLFVNMVNLTLTPSIYFSTPYFCQDTQSEKAQVNYSKYFVI